MSYIYRSLLTITCFAASNVSFAKCFEFVETRPQSLGRSIFWGPADRVCVYRVNGFVGDYWSLRFSDSQGDLAVFASQTEIVGRCPGFCRTYSLTSGNVNGQNVNLDDYLLEFQNELETSTMTIYHEDFSEIYLIREEASESPTSNDPRFVEGQTLTGDVYWQ